MRIARFHRWDNVDRDPPFWGWLEHDEDNPGVLTVHFIIADWDKRDAYQPLGWFVELDGTDAFTEPSEDEIPDKVWVALAKLALSPTST